MPSAIRDRLQADLSAALRERDRARIDVLRATLSAIANAEAVDPSTIPVAERATRTEVDRRMLTEHDVRSVVVAEREELRIGAAELRAVGQGERATVLTEQADLLETYLLETYL